MTLIMSVAVKRSPFGWLIVSVEYFYVLGLGIFPLLVGLDLIGLPDQLAGYESRNGDVQFGTFLHVGLYAIGGACGYFLARRPATKLASKIVSVAIANRIDNYMGFYFVAAISFAATAFYLALVGVDTALLTASATRGGDFSEMAGLEQYQFLKRLATIGVFAVVFVPFIILDGRRINSSFALLMLIAAAVYLQTVARVTLFDTAGVFVILYLALRRRWSWRFLLVVGAIAALLVFTFIYGKTFVAALASYLFQDSRFELVRFGMKDDDLEFFFFHFGHLLYSVDAGLREFAVEGSTIPKDIALAPLGVIPSSAFSAIGLGSLSYQLVPEADRLACINTSYFSAFGECSVPTYLPGFSAYVAPYLGGLAFGFVRFWVYAVIEQSWLDRRMRAEHLWFPYLLFLLALNVLLAIPSSIAFTVFVALFLIFVLAVAKLVLRRTPSSYQNFKQIDRIH
jgi:hypothetical protein